MILLSAYSPIERCQEVCLHALIIVGLVYLSGAQSEVFAQESRAKLDEVVGVSRNPDDISMQVREANAKREAWDPLKGADSLFQSWYETKASLARNLGLNFGFSYTGLFQVATDSLSGDRQTAGQMADVFGTWTLFGRDSDHPGVLGFRGEYRGGLGTDATPQTHFAKLGSGWPNGVGFGEFDFSLVEFWWEQHIIEDRFTVRVGKMLPYALYDYSAFKSPRTGFANAAMGFNPTIAWPKYGLGAMALVRPIDEVYLAAGIHDANGVPDSSGFDSFFNDQEYLMVAEVGWDPGYLNESSANPLAADFHATFWRTDEREQAGRPSGRGFTLAGQQPIGDLVAFLRYGYSEGGASILDQILSGGFAVPGVLGWKQDMLGLGLSWGKPSKQGLDDQFVAEIYHKVQWTQRLAITPSLQVIASPSANPDRDVLALLGVRGRIDF